jgi:hypothetical protein
MAVAYLRVVAATRRPQLGKRQFASPIPSIVEEMWNEVLRQAWSDSGKAYGYRKLHDDLLDQGETC